MGSSSSSNAKSSRSSRNSGCFSNVLRRLLCSGTSPQTHPSDHINVEPNPNTNTKLQFDEEEEANKVHGDHAVQANSESSSGPGIVARLMGLDSLPEMKGKVAGPVTRSRSVNFMDYMLEFDLTNAKHRRVKTSASFRELPPQVLFQHENKKNKNKSNINHDQFLVVYLDNNVGNKGKEAGLKPRKSEKGNIGSCSSSKQKEKVGCKIKENVDEKNKKISKLRNEPRRVTTSGKHSCISRSGAKHVQINHGSNSKAKKKRNQSCQLHYKKKAGYYSDSEKKSYSSSEGLTLSPVSVFDHVHVNNDFANSHQAGNGISAGDSRWLEALKSEKKWSSKCVKYDSHTEGLETKKNFGSTNCIEYYSYMDELVGKPSKLAEEDLIKFSNWMESNKVSLRFEDFEEICLELGDQILNLLLHQLVADELIVGS